MKKLTKALNENRIIATG